MSRADLTGAEARPAFHFAPERNWMNDPNGLVHHDGEWHLFFQHNPDGIDWGNMSWGHAVSRDLVQWEELPVALAATEAEHVFSGSAVVDHRNTSGLGVDGTAPMVAVYTAVDPATGRQTQALASSLDRGRTWERYAGNPVLDIGSNDFRDPKVFWHDETARWVMVLVLAVERTVQLYCSADLVHWEHLSDIGPLGSVAGVWECPDLFPLAVDGDATRTRWVLVVSVQEGAVAGGSGTQYVVGDFDGTVFTTDDEARWLDHGSDNYAAVSFSGRPDDDRVLVGWMSNWDYARVTPAVGVRGLMTVPRRVRLSTVDGAVLLVQEPVLPALGAPSYAATDLAVDGALDLPVTLRQGRVRLSVDPGTARRVGLRVRVGDDEATEVSYDVATGTVCLDRSRSGRVDFHPTVAAAHAAPYRPVDGAVELDVLVDTTSVEVFAGAGEVSLTDLVFPSPESTGVVVFTEGGSCRVLSVEVTHIG